MLRAPLLPAPAAPLPRYDSGAEATSAIPASLKRFEAVAPVSTLTGSVKSERTRTSKPARFASSAVSHTQCD